MNRTAATAFLLGSLLSVGHGFLSSWKNSENYSPKPLQVENGYNDLKRMPMDTVKTASLITRELRQSVVVAVVATTLTGGSFLSSPMPAFAKDTISVVTMTSTGSSELLLRTSPPSFISSIKIASLVIANVETANVQLVAVENDGTGEQKVDLAMGSHAVMDQSQEEETTAMAARQRERADPPGETYLLAQAPAGIKSLEKEITVLAARQRERSDPQCETYLLVQATESKELEMQVELIEEAFAEKEQTLLAYTTATDSPDREQGIEVITTELTKEQEESMFAMGVESEDSSSSANMEDAFQSEIPSA